MARVSGQEKRNRVLNTLKDLVKRLLAIRSVRISYEGINRGILESFGSSRVLSQIYFLASFLTFNREQAATLRGRRNYYRNKSTERTSRVELRRNIHRLEKGLIMRPRRDVFARDYIGETMDFYASAARQCAVSPESMEVSEMDWAHNVLSEYFRVSSDSDPVVRQSRQRFEATTYRASNTGFIPFKKKTLSSITYDELHDLSLQRRSVRWFADRPVSRIDLDKALLVARQAPTACNRLPYEFRVFDDPQMVRLVSELPFGTAGYAHNIPVIIVVVGKLDSYFSPRDRHAIYVDSSLAAMSFMFALETLGLSSSVINWPDFEPLESKMQRMLGLGLSDRVVMLIAIGYADPEGEVPYSQKKELNSIRRYNVLR